MWEGFLHRPGTSCNTVTLGEQVIKLGMGSWLDLWEKNSMYDLRPASCPCNFPLYSEALAKSSTGLAHTSRLSIKEQVKRFAPSSEAGQLLSLDRSSAAQIQGWLVSPALLVCTDCVHTRIHIYIHTYIHTYRHTCVHKYIHTYIQRYIGLATPKSRPGYPDLDLATRI